MRLPRNLTNAACLIAQPLLLNALSIPATIYIIRSLGPSGYGEWSAAATIVAMCAFLTNLGLRTLFVREVAQSPEDVERALAEQISLRGLLGIAAALLAVGICLALRYTPTVVTCAGIAGGALVVTAVSAAMGDALQGQHRIRAFALVGLVAGIGVTTATVIAVWRGAGPVSLTAAYAVGPLVSAAVSSTLLLRAGVSVRVRFDARRSRRLLNDCRELSLNQLVGAVCGRVEQILVPKLVGFAAFGYFTAGSMPADRLSVVPDGLATAFYPVMARHAKEDRAAGDRTVAQLMLASLALCLPVAILITFLSEPISRLLFPHRAAVCRDIMRIVIWSLPIAGLALPMTYALQAHGYHARAANATLCGTLLGTGFAVLLVLRFGVLGACFAGIARQTLISAFLFPALVRALPNVMGRVPVARLLLCAVGMGATLWMLARVATGSLLTSCAVSVVAAVVYGVALLLSGAVSTKWLLGSLRGSPAAIAE